MVKYKYAESGGEPIYYDGSTHLLCIGITGSGKSVTLNSLLWAMFADPPQGSDASAIVLNPKRVGFAWIEGSPRVRLYNDAAQMETIYQALTDEMMTRYHLLQSGEVTEDELQPLYVFQDEMAALLGGGLLLKNATNSIKENLTQLLILARQAKIFVLAFSQTALSEYTAGTLTRANFSSTIIMHVSNGSELAMAANLSGDDVSATMNPTNFQKGEILAATETGKAFKRGMVDYHPPEELIRAMPLLQDAEPADFGFLDRRGL